MDSKHAFGLKCHRKLAANADHNNVPALAPWHELNFKFFEATATLEKIFFLFAWKINKIHKALKDR